MKKIILLCVLLTSLSAFAGSKKNQFPDLPPDAESSDYQAVLENMPFQGLLAPDGLDSIMSFGQRNMAWLNYINSFREPSQKLTFTSKETQRGIPIDQPSEYNPTLILAKFEELKKNFPKEMAEVIFERKDFTKVPPIDTKLYLDMGRELDRSYQTAARWRTMQPWLRFLASRRTQDIRGYYFLSQLPGREEKLKNFNAQTPEMKAKLTEWLIGVCLNGGVGFTTCTTEINGKIQQGDDLEAYYQVKQRRSSQIYNGFFSIEKYHARSDFSWTPNELSVPFWDPARREIQDFVKVNIDDEWKFGNWKLIINFVPESAGDHPRIVFQPDITPHVDGLGKSTIYMNSNQPITEYDANWTIRHEFGHVLGFPDCYVEFYMEERQSIMNYQLDIDNIMCSRRGHVKEINYTELEKAYSNFKK